MDAELQELIQAGNVTEVYLPLNTYWLRRTTNAEGTPDESLPKNMGWKRLDLLMGWCHKRSLIITKYRWRVGMPKPEFIRINNRNKMSIVLEVEEVAA